LPPFVATIVCGACPADSRLKRDMSAPAQKPRPAPVMTMARTQASAAALSTARRTSASISLVRALSLSGRLSVMVATKSSTL
jgi:hypothetical protein